MTKENFPQMLKEWRKANGLSQHGLAEKIGVAKSAVSFYERGIYCPSTETAVKLAELGFDEIPDGLVHRVRCTELKKPLTIEEQRFAEEHHQLVYTFLIHKKLQRDEWYDTVIFGYLRAVKKWFARPALHRYAFSTVAYGSMSTSMANELRKRKSIPRTVSLDDIIPNTDGMTYGDTLCDPRDCVRT